MTMKDNRKINEQLSEQEVLLLRRKLDLLLRTGKLLVESAADTNRIVRNMYRVAAYLTACRAHWSSWPRTSP